MNLKEYIKTAITDITSAISELQAELDNGAIVSPSLYDDIGVDNTDFIRSNHDSNCLMKVTNINFDVATTIDTTEGKDAGGSLNIHVLAANVGGKSKVKLENVSRISFTIPIALPAYRMKTRNELGARSK